MKFTFRTTFIGSLLTLISVTVGIVGAISYRNARFTADDLSAQLLEQTSARVDGEIQKLVTQAVDQNALSQRFLNAGKLQARNFHGLVDYWLQAMGVNSGLSSVFIGVAATGESVGVSRLKGRLSIWESCVNGATGAFEQRDYWPQDYPPTADDPEPPKSAPDMRTRPWYTAARDAHHPIWTETYPFLGVSGMTDVQGVTYATPVYESGGALTGVLTADFDLNGLCAFLQNLHVGQNGFAFVIEQRANGSQHLIAHSDPAILRAGALAANGVIADRRVRALIDTRHANSSAFTFRRFTDQGTNFLGAYRALSGPDVPPWTIGIVLPESDVMERVHRGNFFGAAITGGALLFAIVLGVYIARQVARPLEKLGREMEAIAALRLDPRPIAHSIIIEVDRVATTTEEIKTGLRQKRILEKYVPMGARDDIAQNLAGRLTLGGERVRRAILFSDLRGFTSMSERLTPDAVVTLLNVYLESMTAAILAHGGDINEFIGDAILAVFATSAQAVAAGTAMQQALSKLCHETQDHDLQELRMGIGIHVGDVVEGNIGTADRVKFGVVGDTVNLAARIQDRSRDGKHTCVLVSAAVHDEIPPDFEFELVGDLTMKGKAVPVRVYEVVRRK